MDSIRRLFSWSALLLALSFSTAFGLLYSIAFHVVPKQPVDHKVFLLSLFVFIGFCLMLSRWLKQLHPKTVHSEANPADFDGPTFLYEIWLWICGPKPLVSIGLAILAAWITIALCAALIFIGVPPSYRYSLAFPLVYILLRWSFDNANRGGGHDIGR